METHYEILINTYFKSIETLEKVILQLEQFIYDNILKNAKQISEEHKAVVGNIVNNEISKRFGREWMHRFYFRIRFLESNRLKINVELKQ